MATTEGQPRQNKPHREIGAAFVCRHSGTSWSAWRIELELGNKADLLELGREKHAETVGRPSKKSLSNIDNDLAEQPAKEPAPKHNTQKEIAKAVGVSTGNG